MEEHPWSGIIAVEARRSADGRLLLSGSVRWKTLPVALIDTDGWSIMGRVDTIERIPSDDRTHHFIRASGVSYRPLEVGTPIYVIGNVDMARKQGQHVDMRGLDVRAVAVSADAAAWPECKVDERDE